MPHPQREDSIAIEHEGVDRLANLIVTIVPLVLLGFAVFLAWGNTLHWQDIAVLAISYVLTVAGITVGYHRLFTHRSFKTSAPSRDRRPLSSPCSAEAPDDRATHPPGIAGHRSGWW